MPRRSKTLFAGDHQVRIIELDGWLALGAHLPPKEKRGLVLVDPPFEQDGEFDRLAVACARRTGAGRAASMRCGTRSRTAAAVAGLPEALRRLRHSEDPGYPLRYPPGFGRAAPRRHRHDRRQSALHAGEGARASCCRRCMAALAESRGAGWQIEWLTERKKTGRLTADLTAARPFAQTGGHSASRRARHSSRISS